MTNSCEINVKCVGFAVLAQFSGVQINYISRRYNN